MESHTRDQNKVLIRELVKKFPKKIKYAERISQHLERKGYRISEAMVYQTATGTSYNPLIAWKIAVLFRAYRMQDASLNRTLTKLSKN